MVLRNFTGPQQRDLRDLMDLCEVIKIEGTILFRFFYTVTVTSQVYLLIAQIQGLYVPIWHHKILQWLRSMYRQKRACKLTLIFSILLLQALCPLSWIPAFF